MFKHVCTVQEHPLLGAPWYYLHPCFTPALMQLLLGRTEANLLVHMDWHDESNVEGPGREYLLSWMSAVLPLFGLDIPLVHRWLRYPGNSYCLHSDGSVSSLLCLEEQNENVRQNKAILLPIDLLKGYYLTTRMTQIGTQAWWVLA